MKHKFLFCFLAFMLVTLFVVSCSSEPTNSSTAETSVEKITTKETAIATLPSITPCTTYSPVESSASETFPCVSTSPTVHTISPEEAKEMMEQENVTLVDVRRIDEYESGHIPKAILVPNENIITDAPTKLPNKNAVLLIYCRSGRRSAEAAQKLISLGYRHVYDFGGIIDWPYETTQ